MSARITLHFWSRCGDLYVYTSIGWVRDGEHRAITHDSVADARRFAREHGWHHPGATARRVFIRFIQAGRVEHLDLVAHARPLPRPDALILAHALAVN
jgi:hypothetical protein